MTLASPWTGPSCASNAGFAPMATPALDLLAVGFAQQLIFVR
jgi:hypothetical protein